MINKIQFSPNWQFLKLNPKKQKMNFTNNTLTFKFYIPITNIPPNTKPHKHLSPSKAQTQVGKGL